jgi:hypothetical protein
LDVVEFEDGLFFRTHGFTPGTTGLRSAAPAEFVTRSAAKLQVTPSGIGASGEIA